MCLCVYITAYVRMCIYYCHKYVIFIFMALIYIRQYFGVGEENVFSNIISTIKVKTDEAFDPNKSKVYNKFIIIIW